MDFCGAQVVKSPCNAGDLLQSLIWEDSNASGQLRSWATTTEACEPYLSCPTTREAPAMRIPTPQHRKPARSNKRPSTAEKKWIFLKQNGGAMGLSKSDPDCVGKSIMFLGELGLAVAGPTSRNPWEMRLVSETEIKPEEMGLRVIWIKIFEDRDIFQKEDWGTDWVSLPLQFQEGEICLG